MQDRVRRGDLVIDVGAHEGDRTAMFRELGARVVAMEPQPSMVRLLRERFDSDEGVTVLGKGVAEVPGFKEIAISDSTTVSTMEPEWEEMTTASGRFKNIAWTERIEVEVTTLDLLIEEYGRPTFIKVDVEGFEPHVFAGLSRPVPAVSFEFVRERPGATAECVQTLNALGLSEFNFSDGLRSPALCSTEWMSAAALIQALAELPDQLSMGDVYARLPADLSTSPA